METPVGDSGLKQFLDALRNDLTDFIRHITSSMRSASGNRMQIGLVCCMLLFGVIFMGAIIGGNRVLFGDLGEDYYKELLREFQAIPLFPDSVEGQRANRFSRWAPHHALVEGSYNTTASYLELHRYYDRELTSRGWKFQNEHPLKVWGEDSGAWAAEYCKGELAASLDYGSRVNSGYTYSLALSWGLRKCKRD